MKLIANPADRLQGLVKVPGDKSVSHRAIMLGSLARGTTRVSNFLEGEDSIATLKAFKTMGVKIARPAKETVIIEGAGINGLKAPDSALDLGNSGTAMRLMSGLLAGQNFSSTLTGDASLSSRPMRRITEPLGLMAANIGTTKAGTAPLSISPANLNGINYKMPVASAQVKSAVLLAGLYATGKTCVTEPVPTRNHTERMLLGFGYGISKQGNKICLKGGGELIGCDVNVPNDISSAAFFMVAACIASQAEITLSQVGINPTRTGIIDILKLMNADIAVENEKLFGGEPVADIKIKSSNLKGIQIPENLVPLAIDEFPAIFIAAACAEGTTILTGAKELRVKESDRIAAMEQGLITLGTKAQATADGMIIEGGKGFIGGSVNGHDDHRIAMAFAVASLRASSPVIIEQCSNIATSFPGFVELANSTGLDINKF